MGKPLVAPTLRTPGICFKRSIKLEKKIAWLALAFGSSNHGSETSMVTILSTRNPGFTSSTFIKLRPSKPAPTTSTRVMAICAATMARPMRWLPCDPAWPRPPSARPSRKSPEVARAAVNTPSPAATAVESNSANRSTGILTADAVQPRQILRRKRNQSRHAPVGAQYAEAAADQRKQQRFGEELTDQPAARGAERVANGQLTLPCRGLRQQQVRDVRARDQQQKTDRAEQDQQRSASLPGDRFLQRHDNSVFKEIVALLAGSLVNALRERADVSIGLLDAYAVAQPSDRVIVVGSPAGIFAFQIGGQPQIGVRRKTKFGRQHADHGKY